MFRLKYQKVTIYHPTGQKELELVKQSGYTKWPPRLPEQPIFYPEWWIPAEELEQLNQNIVDQIEVIGEYRA